MRAGAVLLGGIGVALAAWRALAVRRSVGPYADHWRDRARQPGALVYVALGDSAAQGVGASAPQRGYVGLLADRLEEATGRRVRVVNLSVSGAKVTGVTGEQLDGLAALQAAGPVDVVTVAIGGNDAGRTAAATFTEQVAVLVRRLPAGAYVADVPDFGGGPRLAPARVAALAVREALAQRPDLVPVALEAATAAMRWSEYAGDFFHPGDRGHRRWADAFWSPMAPRMAALRDRGAAA